MQDSSFNNQLENDQSFSAQDKSQNLNTFVTGSQNQENEAMATEGSKLRAFQAIDPVTFEYQILSLQGEASIIIFFKSGNQQHLDVFNQVLLNQEQWQTRIIIYAISLDSREQFQNFYEEYNNQNELQLVKMYWGGDGEYNAEPAALFQVNTCPYEVFIHGGILKWKGQYDFENRNIEEDLQNLLIRGHIQENNDEKLNRIQMEKQNRKDEEQESILQQLLQQAEEIENEISFTQQGLQEFQYQRETINTKIKTKTEKIVQNQYENVNQRELQIKESVEQALLKQTQARIKAEEEVEDLRRILNEKKPYIQKIESELSKYRKMCEELKATVDDLSLQLAERTKQLRLGGGAQQLTVEEKEAMTLWGESPKEKFANPVGQKPAQIEIEYWNLGNENEGDNFEEIANMNNLWINQPDFSGRKQEEQNQQQKEFGQSIYTTPNLTNKNFPQNAQFSQNQGKSQQNFQNSTQKVVTLRNSLQAMKNIPQGDPGSLAEQKARHAANMKNKTQNSQAGRLKQAGGQIARKK